MRSWQKKQKIYRLIVQIFAVILIIGLLATSLAGYF
jgi:uncharacterized membrane protein